MWPYPRLCTKPAGLGASMMNLIALSDPPQLLKGTTMDPLQWQKPTISQSEQTHHDLMALGPRSHRTTIDIY